MKGEMEGGMEDVDGATTEPRRKSRHQQQSSSLLLVDVREIEERDVGTLPNSVHVKDAAVQQLLHGTRRTRTTMDATPLHIVCFCTVGMRSALTARQLLSGSAVDVSTVPNARATVTGGNEARDAERHDSAGGGAELQHVRVYNYSLMSHMWAGGTLTRPDGLAWDGRVHVFSPQYADFFSGDVPTAAFPWWTALRRGLPILRNVLWSLGSGGRSFEATTDTDGVVDRLVAEKGGNGQEGADSYREGGGAGRLP